MADFLPGKPEVFNSDSFIFKGWFDKLWKYIRGQTSVEVSQTATPFSVALECWFYPVDTTAGAITVNLPAATGNLGKQYVIKRIAGANNVVITPNGSDTIDGSATFTLNTSASLWIVSNGDASWYRIVPV